MRWEAIPQRLRYRQVPTRQQCEPTGSAAATSHRHPPSSPSILHPRIVYQRGTCTAVFCIYLEVGSVPAASCRTKTTSSKKQNKKKKEKKERRPARSPGHQGNAEKETPQPVLQAAVHRALVAQQHGRPQKRQPPRCVKPVSRSTNPPSPCPQSPAAAQWLWRVRYAHTQPSFRRVLELAPWSCLR